MGHPPLMWLRVRPPATSAGRRQEWTRSAPGIVDRGGGRSMYLSVLPKMVEGIVASVADNDRGAQPRDVAPRPVEGLGATQQHTSR